MTVQDSTRKVRENGDGAIVEFQFAFPAKVTTDITVKKILNSTGVATTQTVGVDYTIVLNTSTEGGTITYTVAPTTLQDSFILRETTQDQQTALPIGGNFPEISVENEIDRSRMIDIEIQEQMGRAILIPETDVLSDLLAPMDDNAASRAGKAWVWNSDGDGLVTGDEIGNFTGDWAASRAYIERDLIKDTSNDNIYYCNTAHTSVGAEPISSNADVAKWDLIVDAASATASAAAAASSAADAAADLVLTNADVVLTNADVVLTGNDVTSTNADVVSTGDDVTATNADVVTTTQDAIDTAADVVQTGLDAASTAADVITVAAAANLEGTAIVSTGETGGSKFLREDGDNSSSWQDIPSGAAKNLIFNGGCSIAQLGNTFTSAGSGNNDDSYTLDGIILLSDGNDIVDVTQEDNVFTGFQKSIKLDVETASKKFGVLHIIEGIDSSSVIGGVASLSFTAKVNNAGAGRLDNIKAVVLSWDSTRDSVTSDVISSWNAEDTTPTFAANWTAENTPVNLNVTTSEVRYTIENISIDTASTANVAIFIWADGLSGTVTDTLEMTGFQLESNATASDSVIEDIASELTKAHRQLFVPSDGIDGDLPVNTAISQGTSHSTTRVQSFVHFPVQMRAVPSLSVTASEWDVHPIDGAQVVATNITIGGLTGGAAGTNLEITTAGHTDSHIFVIKSNTVDAKMIFSARL